MFFIFYKVEPNEGHEFLLKSNFNLFSKIMLEWFVSSLFQNSQKFKKASTHRFHVPF